MRHERELTERRLESRYLDGERTVRISLPASYHLSRRRYPVLYLHDGQNVFSSAGPDCCFGWGSWQVDFIADQLAAAEKMHEIILVAIDHSRHRYAEYRGPAHRAAAKQTRESKRSAATDNAPFENYASFLVKELKPTIDHDYRTQSSPAHSGLMGASLGGICSLAVAWKHPKVFGLSATLSGSFHIEHNHFLEHVLRTYRGKTKPLRIYLDSGTTDTGGDDDDHELTKQVAAELRRIGWRDGKNLQHFVDPRVFTEDELQRAGLRHDKWQEAQASQHNEFYWRQRLWRPLTFLFPPQK